MVDNYYCSGEGATDPTMLKVEIRELGSPADAEIALVGDLDDVGGKPPRRKLAHAVKTGRVNLRIDLDRVGLLNSTGLAALIATLRLARDRGGDVRVQAGQPHIRRVMELTGLSRVFRLTSPDDVVAATAGYT